MGDNFIFYSFLYILFTNTIFSFFLSLFMARTLGMLKHETSSKFDRIQSIEYVALWSIRFILFWFYDVLLKNELRFLIFLVFCWIYFMILYDIFNQGNIFFYNFTVSMAEEDDEMFGGLYEGGHWVWDNNVGVLTFMRYFHYVIVLLASSWQVYINDGVITEWTTLRKATTTKYWDIYLDRF